MILDRRHLLCAAALLPFAAQAEPEAGAMRAIGQKTGKKLLVLDFEMIDTSNEPTDQRADHARRLEIARDAIVHGLAARETYVVLDRAPIKNDIDAVMKQTYLRTCNGCEFDLAQKVGADLVLLGVVNKVSLLILSMSVSIFRVENREMIYHQGFDFRGDSDRSYEKTGAYIAERLSREPAT